MEGLTNTNLTVAPTSLHGTVNLPKLDGKNYQSWAELINIVLELRGLKKAIKEDCNDEIANLQAKLILLESMNESHRAQVRGCNTAKEIYARLELVYADKSAANIYRLLMQYYRYTKRSEDSMSEHIGKMDEMRNQLADLGEKQSDAVYQVSLIGSLPVEYNSIMEVWELTHPSMRTTSNLVGRLLKREEDLKKTEPQAMMASQRPKLTREEIEAKKKVTHCGICKQKGHWKAECPQNPAATPYRSANKSGGASGYVAVDEGDATKGVYSASSPSVGCYVEEEPDMVAFNVWNDVGDLSHKWVSDSGASSHMCKNEGWFNHLKLTDQPRSVLVGDGKKLAIKGVGAINIKAYVEGEWIESTMQNVLFVPDLSTNLFSIGAAAEKGIRTVFEGSECKMTLKGKTVATGVRLNEKLYLMRFRVNTEPVRKSVALNAAVDKTMSAYHRRLGHASSARIKSLLSGLDHEVPKDETVECDVCPSGKARHVSHPTVGARATEAGYLHVDLSGIVNKESIEGYRYYMLCLDEETHFNMVYFCKAKSEVPQLIAKMIIDFEVIAKTPVKAIISDNGSEFCNEPTRLLMLKEKIRHITSAPFCPQQNGRIERAMQTVTNMARTMLLASKLPKNLWSEAVRTAVYLKNRLPIRDSKISPYEKLNLQKPTIDHLVEFGAPCHIMINDKYLTKWDARTLEAFAVGYTVRRNTYRAFVPSLNRVIRTCDVVFAKHQQLPTQQVRMERETELPLVVNFDARQYKTSDVLDESKEETQRAAAASSASLDSPQRTLTGQGESTPKPKTTKLCTGKLLDEFFNQYVNRPEQSQEPIYASDEMEETHIYANDSVAEKQAIPLPPPPTLSPHSNNGDVSETTLLAKSGETSEQMNLTDGSEVAVPKNFHEAMMSEDQIKWKEAIEAELEAHKKNDTWREYEQEIKTKPLTTKWVFTLKRSASGQVEKYKARLVARGFEQREGIDFSQTFAPVARLDSIRFLLAVSGICGLHVAQFDVSTAFLNGTLDEEVFIEVPLGLKAKSRALKLNKALYGLRQAPRCWNSTFNAALLERGFEPTRSDTCVYTNHKRTVFVLIYVDDGLVIGKDRIECEEFIESLASQFDLKRLKGDQFLGIKIEIKDGLKLSQQRYIEDVLERFGMTDAKGYSTPIAETASLYEISDQPKTNAPFRELIGCLQYIACCTRPDILFAVAFLSRFNQEPKERHWEAAKRVLRYLKQTKTMTLDYQSSSSALQPIAYSDADWAGDVATRRSTSGWLIILGGGPITFASRRQDTVAQSSTEAEFIAANGAVRELKWLVQLSSELGIEIQRPILRIDNHSTIKLIESNETKRRSKYIDVKYHFIRDQLKQELFSLEAVFSEKQIADYLTKPLNGNKLASLLELMKWTSG